MLFSHCLGILELCSGNEEIRVDLVDRYKFPTVLASYLEKINDRKTIKKILSLLNELTYAIQITWSEPYLAGLVQRLFEIISYKEEAKESAALALSVLVNLAYKNPPVIEIFFSTINTEFLKNIQSFGVLTNKMYYILGQNSQKDLLASIKLYFKEIERLKAQKSPNSADLGRTIDFALDVFRKENEFMRTNKSFINSNLEELLESNGSPDGFSSDELKCMPKILEFLYVLIELGESSGRWKIIIRMVAKSNRNRYKTYPLLPLRADRRSPVPPCCVLRLEAGQVAFL